MSEKSRIGNHAKVRRGASPRPIGDPKYFGGTVGWVRISDVTSAKKYLRKTEQYVSPLGESLSVRVDCGDLIMSICATIGRPVIVDMPACIHDGFVQFYDVNKDDKEYMYYLLQFHENDLERKGQPGTQVNLNTTIVENFEAFFPTSLSEQRKIARILSTVDAVIEKTEAAIAKYKAIKAGMMRDLFTRGIDVATGKLRPCYEESPELYRESELGWVPKEWEVKRLREITLKIADRDHYTPKYLEFGIPMISPKDFDDKDDIIFEKCSHVSLEEHTHNMQKTDIRPNDLIFTRIGALLGKIALVTPIMPQFSILHSACLIRANEKIICPEYLCFFIKSFVFQMQIKSEIQSIGVPDLGLDKIGAFTICYPENINEQKCISRKFESIFWNINCELNVFRKYQQLKQALMSDLLTGKVRVKYEEEEEEEEKPEAQ